MRHCSQRSRGSNTTSKPEVNAPLAFDGGTPYSTVLGLSQVGTKIQVGRYLNNFLSRFAYTFMDMDPKASFFLLLASPHHVLQEFGLKSKNDFGFWEIRNAKIEIIIYLSDYDSGRVRYHRPAFGGGTTYGTYGSPYYPSFTVLI